jgi:hypothetical protein
MFSLFRYATTQVLPLGVWRRATWPAHGHARTRARYRAARPGGCVRGSGPFYAQRPLRLRVVLHALRPFAGLPAQRRRRRLRRRLRRRPSPPCARARAAAFAVPVGILVAHVAVPLLDAEWAHKTSEQGGPLAVAVDPPQASTPRAQKLFVRAPA